VTHAGCEAPLHGTVAFRVLTISIVRGGTCNSWITSLAHYHSTLGLLLPSDHAWTYQLVWCYTSGIVYQCCCWWFIVLILIWIIKITQICIMKFQDIF
jgi:hypothetical protein